jgi:hypothetical protein
MAQPTNSAVHVDAALTNISVAFLQNADNFVATKVFPNVPVAKQSDRYFVFDRGDFNRDEAQVRAPGTESAGGGYELDNTPTYFANVFAFHHDVPDQIRANADPAVDVERAATEYVMHKMLIRREKAWTASFFSSGVWANEETGVDSSPSAGETIRWSDQTSGDPIGDIRAAKTKILESTGYMPNRLVLTQPVMDALVDHPDIVDRVKYSGGVGNTSPAMVNEQTLAALFGIDQVVISRAIENTAAQGAEASHSFISGNNALLTHAAQAPSLMTPTGGYTFSWSGFMGQSNAFGVATKRFYIDEIESTRVEGQMAFDQKLVSDSLGYFFGSIVS